MVRQDPFRPAKRVAGQKQDVWSVLKSLNIPFLVQSLMLSQDYCQRSGYSISRTANYKYGPRLFVSTQYHIKAIGRAAY
jgi:hypothetical protein